LNIKTLTTLERDKAICHDRSCVTLESTRFIRYPGGKQQRLLKYIVPYLPHREEIKGKYTEPFAGSAAVFFELDPYRAILSNLNKELIDLYLGIKYHVSDVWQIFSGFPTTKEGYYRVRDNKFDTEDLAYKAARTLYLNVLQCCLSTP
jgi:DNA adenine methylase